MRNDRWLRLALQEMLPTIMSQMGMSLDSGLASEAGRRKFAGRAGDQQSNEAGNEQAGAEADDDDVPGKERVSPSPNDLHTSFPFPHHRPGGKLR